MLKAHIQVAFQAPASNFSLLLLFFPIRSVKVFCLQDILLPEDTKQPCGRFALQVRNFEKRGDNAREIAALESHHWAPAVGGCRPCEIADNFERFAHGSSENRVRTNLAESRRHWLKQSLDGHRDVDGHVLRRHHVVIVHKRRIAKLLREVARACVVGRHLQAPLTTGGVYKQKQGGEMTLSICSEIIRRWPRPKTHRSLRRLTM